MSFNVVIIALLVTLVRGQLFPTAPPSCSNGCSFSSIFSGTIGGQVTIPYSNAKINIDSAVNLASLTIQGTQNTIRVTTDTPISLGDITLTAGNNVIIFDSNTQVSANSILAFGDVTLNAGSIVNVINGTVVNNATLVLNAGARLGGEVEIAEGSVAHLGADLSSEVYALGYISISGSAVFGNVGLGEVDIYGTVEVIGQATTIDDVYAYEKSSVNVTSSGIFTIFATFYSEAEIYVAGTVYVVPYPTPTPSPTPSSNSTNAPTVAPTAAPTVAPTAAPTVEPTVAPTPNATSNSSSSGSFDEEYPSGFFVHLGGNVKLAGGVIAADVYQMGGSDGEGLSASLSGEGQIGDRAADVVTTFVTVSGTINIGNSPGTMTVNGDWTSSANTVFNLEIASPTVYDRLIVDGNVILGGTLNVILIDGYHPFHLARYTFITAGYIAPYDYFNTVSGSTDEDRKKWTSQATYTEGIATYAGASSIAVSLVAVVVCVLASLL